MELLEKCSVLNSHGPFGELACFIPEMSFGPRFTQRPRSGGELCMFETARPRRGRRKSERSKCAAHAQEEKEKFTASLDAKGRQLLRDLESLPKPVWLSHD
jgi:hypothetical protein